MPGPATLARLQDALENKSVLFVQLRRNLLEIPFGVPVLLSDELLTLQFLRDFDLDGYAAIPVQHISRVKRRAFEHTYDEICNFEGVTERVKPPFDCDCSSILALFSSLRRGGEYAIIECVVKPGTPKVDYENHFLMGPIVGLSDTSVAIHSFDAQGSRDPKPTTVSFDQILNVQWDSRYIQVWQRYMSR